MNTTHKVVAGLVLGAGLMMSTPNMASAADAAAIGSTQDAGPFQVTLIGAPQRGRTYFQTRVTRDGKLVPNAKVSMNLSMPNHKHGATVGQLDDMGLVYGQYAGTMRTRMSGTYDARVMVNEGGDKGTALYRFNSDRNPFVAHLGMWHPAGGFEVRLTTDPASTTAQSGENRFRVQVMREGFPVTDANVSVHFIMPLMSKMGSSETYATLSPQNGAYEGSDKLLHTGAWQAHVTVKSGGAKGIATYDFPAGG